MLVKDYLLYTQEKLKSFGIKSFKLEARLIFSHLLKTNSANLVLFNYSKLGFLQKLKLHFIILKRKKHIPLFYIFKVKHFWNYDFFINKNVLIPRNESELLIEYILKHKQNKVKNYNILDLGTGSGVLGLTLLKEYKNANALLVDYSIKALSIAKKNAKKLACKNRAVFLHSYLTNKIAKTQKFDIIVANLPYIDITEQEFMAYETKTFEPKIALYAKENGLKLYKELLPNIKDLLSKNGIFIFEFGFKQAEQIKQICNYNNFKNFEILKDLNGIERFCLVYF